MSINESVAYLKGLAEGLEIDTSKKEGKLLTAMIDVLDEMADYVTELQETCDGLDELVDTIDEDLGSLEEDFYGDEEDDEEIDCDGEIYEVTCPKCGDTVYLDEGTLLEGDIDCPNCGQTLELEIDECECDCDCEDCNHE